MQRHNDYDLADAYHGASPAVDEERLATVVADTVRLCRQIVEQSGDCIKVLDGHARLLWMNVAGQRLMEICDFAPLVGRCWFDFWAGESRDAAARAFAEARAGGVGRFTGPSPTMGGTMKWWNVVLTALPPDAAGDRLVCTSRDVTDLVRMAERQRDMADAERTARAEAESARRSTDALLHNVSHDLRAPLNAMLGWSRLLRDERLSASAHDAVNGLESAAVRQIGMVDKLLEAARLGAESLRLELDTIDLADVAKDVLRLLQPLIDAKRLAVHLTSPAALTGVLADRGQLQRAVCNLVSNAVKFTPENGTIRVEIVPGVSTVQLSVIDSGAGLTAASLARVFDRFWSDPAPSEESGAGLGLAIVRSIVELHGGTVEGHSDGPGRGARFTVSLPLSSTHSLAGPAAARERNAVDLHGIRVMLVAPDGPARNAVAGTLQHAGVSLATCATAVEALSRWRPPVDVLILDSALAANDLRTIADHAAGASAPVLVLAPEELSFGPGSAGWARMSTPLVARELTQRVREMAQGLDRFSTTPGSRLDSASQSSPFNA